jgi:hypothetical protein
MDKGLVAGDAYANTGSKRGGSGFLDVGAEVNRGLNQSRGNSNVRQSQSKKQQADALINKAMSGMKSEMDLTSLSDAQQKGVRDYLFTKKMEYAGAASRLSGLRADHPEYIKNKDIMESVNRTFLQLKNNLDAYGLNKVEFYDSFKTGLLSKSNTDEEYSLNQQIYDPSAIFKIGNNGALLFNYDGGEVNYSDIKEPALIDYKTGKSVMDEMVRITNQKQEIEGMQSQAIRLKLKTLFSSNKGSAASFIHDEMITPGLINRIPKELLNDPDRIDELEDSLIDVLLQSVGEARKSLQPKGVGQPSEASGNTKPTMIFISDEKTYKMAMEQLGIKPDEYIPIFHNGTFKIVNGKPIRQDQKHINVK